MMSSQIYFLCVVFLFICSRLIGVHSDDLHFQGYQNPVTTTDYQSTEQGTEQVRNQPVSSPGCPQRCSCKKNDTHHIISVDCSSTGLEMVPDLPETTVELSLMNNSISYIDCKSFSFLFNLEILNLAFNEIYQLPKCGIFSQARSLLNLTISGNHIKILKEKHFQNLTHLKTLDLSLNFIKYLGPSTFSDLVQLVNLNLSFNHIDSINSDAFTGLYSLKNLTLNNNLLDTDKSFPEDVFQDLGALEMLDVKGNLGRIDKAVSALKNLSHLYIQVNRNYRVFGAGFRELTNLRVLDLSSLCYLLGDTRYKLQSYCHFSRFKSYFFSNIRTENDLELYLSNCSLKAINKLIFPKHLVTLDLSNNEHLKNTQSGKSWMKSLVNTRINYLDLSWTFYRPKRISKSYFTYLAKTNLKCLVLKQNQIEAMELHDFPKTVEKLNIDNNSIMLTDLYSEFVSANHNDFKLKELYVNDQQDISRKSKQISQYRSTTDANIIGNFTGEAGRWSSPSKFPDIVYLNGSQIFNTSITMRKDVNSGNKDMADVSKHSKVLNKDELNCLSNLKERDPDIQALCLPPDLEVIYANSAIFATDFESVPHIRIVNNTVLRHVEAANNPLTTLLGPVENVPSLQYLNLSRNQCTNLGVNFFKYMVNLQTLALSGNSIGISLAVDVDGLTFSTLTKLKLLDISNNTIIDLSRSAFINNRNLQTLNLSNNQLIKFQPTISTILNMSSLDLSVNLLPGLSEETTEELKLLKFRNKHFTINLLHNRFFFTCDYLSFLDLVVTEPNIFFSVEQLEFTYINGTKFSYKDLAHHFPPLAKKCLAQLLFDIVLIIFFVVVGIVTISAVIYHKRWKLRYLYYIGHRRMHIGEHFVDYAPVADVFLTYDQEELHWRRFMQQTFLPGLNQRNITFILGEVDFPGGGIMTHIISAVVGTRKTVVLLSADTFYNRHREYEVNLSIMREMDTRSLKIVPIFVEDVDLALYPREIGIFLRNQWERCLRYSDSDEFWDGFLDAVREDN